MLISMCELQATPKIVKRGSGERTRDVSWGAGTVVTLYIVIQYVDTPHSLGQVRATMESLKLSVEGERKRLHGA